MSYKKIAFTVLTVIWMATSMPAMASYIVNTGTPSGGPGWSFYANQYFAGKFSIGESETVNSLEAYFSSGSPGNVTYQILAQGGIDPGAVLFSQVAAVSSATLGWHGVFGLSETLPAGTYWVAAVPDANINGVEPGSVPNPMLAYDQANLNGYEAGSANNFDFSYLKTGFRIDATPAAPTLASVPEPGSIALLGLGILSFAASRRKSAK